MKKYNAPKVKESKGIQLLTSIWIVPLLAMVIALWLVYQYYSKIGPTIKLSFKSNAGLIANQSQIKFRDVTVGMVTKISLSPDGSGVIVNAIVNKEISKYLNQRAKFWIVHPDVGSHGVSGLDTLISGSYIKLHGVKEEENKHNFIGLEKPYIDTDAKGNYYLLSAPESYNITESSNVYYRMIKVGRVERVGISPDGKQVNFTIFIKDDYTAYINNRSQFYTQSNFTMDFSQAKLDFTIANFSQIIHGGISIYTPTQTIKQKDKTDFSKKRVFPLYKSLSQMKTKHLSQGEDEKIYKFKFKESITKLEIGSPIEFNGFQVGYVTEIDSSFNEKSKKINSEVFALIQTKAFYNKHANRSGEKVINSLIRSGLKAQLDSAIPMVGAQFIDLVFDKKRLRAIRLEDNITLFPTIKKVDSPNILDEIKKVIVKIEKLELEKLLASATKLIDDNNPAITELLTSSTNFIESSQQPIENLLVDMEQTILKVNETIDNLSLLTQNINQMTQDEALNQIPSDISATLQELQSTLINFQVFTQGYDSNSKFSDELSATLKELSLAAESIERISRKLERKPNALLLGDD